MIRVAALTEGVNIPSSRFRVRQYVTDLSRYGVLIDDFPKPFSNDRWAGILPRGLRIRSVPPLWPVVLGVEAFQLASLARKVAASWSYDVTWLSRHLYLGYPTLEGVLKKPLVFDVDDAIWLNKPYGFRATKYVAQRADRVVVGNAYLAEWFGQYNDNIIIAPTAIDTERFCPIQRDDSKPFTIGWTGTSSNFNYLYAVNRALEAFFKHAHDARMLVVSDKRPVDLCVPAERFDFIQWTAENEVSSVQQMDVGLMPLPDDIWTRGKCSFKMLQYMACGKPVVVSPIGMNGEVLAKGDVGFGAVHSQEWLDALVHLYENRAAAAALGVNGREVVEREYSQQVIGEVLAEVLIGAAK